MAKSIRLTALALAALLCLGGCSESASLDERVFAVVMTLDAVEEGRLRLGVQINTGASAQSAPESAPESAQQSALQQGAYYLLSTTGQDYAQALTLLRVTLPRQLDFSHLQELVVSEDLARSQAMPGLLRDVLRTDTVRPGAYLLVARKDALDFAAHQRPFVGTRLSEYLALRMDNARRQGGVGIATLKEAWTDMEANRADTAATYAAVNDFSATVPLTPDAALDDLPGHLPRTSVNQTEYLGAALFCQGVMVGAVTGAGMALTHLLRGDVRQAPFVTQGATFMLTQRRAPRHTIIKEVQGYMLRFELYLAAEPGGGLWAVSTDTLQSALEQALTDQLLFYQSLGCDPVGFGYQAATLFPTLQAWQAFDWRTAFAGASVQVRVRLTPGEGE
ncbi:MAG: Ger(x)C family spore germination C-terminal domain-containing protein [Oscillospiraceae bacterium]|nr:Ger(x)C family spore germination C-terminal domain-containing protein [Oscillospiraceae bacterium]